ncbi:MAG: MFS transporter, partial [Solirubrobacteraceae bacterium]
MKKAVFVPSRSDPSGNRRRLAVAALCAVQVVDVLGVTVVVAALPAMLVSVNATPSAAGVVATSYAMCFGGLLLLGARLGDRYGHRRVLLVGLVLFAGASVIAGSASSLAMLVVSRGLQGAAAAACVPAALRLLSAACRDEGQRRRALGAWSAAGA